MTQGNESQGIAQHPFERSGLGIAPFRCIGVERRVGPIRTQVAPGVTVEVGAPGQPMGTCAHCGTGIAECCIIQDANGKRFVVGNQCVLKTLQGSGAGTVLERTHAKALKEARKAHELEQAAALNDRLANDAALRATLAALPSPNAWQREHTMLDWALWMMRASGAAGRTKVRRAIAKVEGGAK